MNSWVRMPQNKIFEQAEQMSRKLSYNIVKRQESFMCPSCSMEVKIRELIEKNGNLGCRNCTK